LIHAYEKAGMMAGWELVEGDAIEGVIEKALG
jgi:hypothetical protein